MDIKDCIDFTNENNLCYFATMEGDQPRVRALMLCFADETGFYFNTESTKALAKQLNNNQKVEACFNAKGKVLRVTGKIEFIDDMDIRTRVYDSRRDTMDRCGVKDAADPLLVVFAIRSGEAFFWTMADNMKEAELPRIKF
jgi:pyridoxamine 5'-phosphate oxidase